MFFNDSFFGFFYIMNVFCFPLKIFLRFCQSTKLLHCFFDKIPQFGFH